MAWFPGLGIAGSVLLALSPVLDGLLDGASDGVLGGSLDDGRRCRWSPVSWR